MGIPIVNDILNFILGKKGDDAKQEAIEDQIRKIEALGLPEFAQGSYAPSLYDLPERLNLQEISEDPATRKMQMEMLQAFKDRAEGLTTARNDYGRSRAIQEANQMAKSREEAILSNAAARGVAGSGLEMALRQQGGQEAAGRAQDASLQGALQAAMEGLQSQSIYGKLLESLRGQDLDVAARNVGIANQGRLYNVDQGNRVGMANRDITNQAQRYNMERTDKNAISKYEAELRKRMLAAGMLNPQISAIESRSGNERAFASGLGDSVANLAMMGIGAGMGMPGMSAGGFSGLTGNPYIGAAIANNLGGFMTKPNKITPLSGAGNASLSDFAF